VSNRRVIDFKSINLGASQDGSANTLPSAIRLPSNQNIPLPASNFVRPFGLEPDLAYVYPNDVVQLDIYNAVDQYLETNYRVTGYDKTSTTVTVDVENDLTSLGYQSGRYKTVYKFYRNYLGSGDTHKLQVQEISADRLEIRVVPTISNTHSNTSFLSAFETRFFQIPKPQVLPNLFIHKDANTSVQVFDYVQDRFTFPSSPYSIIFKLNTPISDGVVIGDLVWLSQQLNEDHEDDIVIIPPKPVRTTTQIAGPNWDILVKEQTSTSTAYKDWDDLLSTNTTTSQDLVNRLFSSSFIEGIPLNVDYKDFNNFIHFGSAAERLQNFRYKMSLLEQYDSRIASLTVDLDGLPSSSVTASSYFQANVIDAQTKRAALIGTFDGYEKYLFYESSSYVTNSYGEFYPTTWPKSNSTKPYTRFSYTSSQVEEWFDGITTSASLFDENNNNALYRLVPAHVLENPTNDSYILFVNMVGHYFDLVYTYIKQMSYTYNREQSLLDGFSKELVYHVAKNLGVDFENGNTLDDLWSYVLGTDASGSIASTFGISTEDKTKEIWKRIINNLPYLLKTKGTDRGLRALINCFGIPRTILRIREYGGVEPDFDTKTDFVHERFNYALQVGYGGVGITSLYGSAIYGSSSYSTADPTELISVPWKPLENNLLPMATQLRVKMVKNQTKEQSILEVANKWKIKTHTDNNGYQYIGFYLSGSAGWATASVSSSIYDGAFHSITLQRDVADDATNINQTYILIVKRTNYEKVVSTQTASLFINGLTSSSYNNSFITTGTLWIPGSGSFTVNDSSSMTLFTGSIQEFRYWKTSLEDSILDNQALAPTNFQGNPIEGFTGSTSSFYDLSFRLCLGSDNRKIDFGLTSSFGSQHPDQSANMFGDSVTSKTATFHRLRSPLYEPIVEIHSMEWPDMGANRSISTKIRIDETITAGTNQLYPNIKVEKALTDNNPPDSPRLGVYFSPTNETNQDIAEQFGGLSLDDFIGDPSQMGLDYYPDLQHLNFEYFKKYRSKGAVQNYIRLLRHYDAALFKIIKKFIPYRANTQVGLVIEPHLLHRSKVSTKLPTVEELHYSSSIDVPDSTIDVGGFVSDGDSEPFRDSPVYVPEAVINSNQGLYLQISGDEQQVREYNDVVSYPDRDFEGTRQGIKIPDEFISIGGDDFAVSNVVGGVDGVILRLTSSANEYNQVGSIDEYTDTIVIGETSYGRNVRYEGSQYVFMTYATSGSGSTRSEPYWITSSRYDYHEALCPVIMTSHRSGISNLTSDVTDTNIYGKKAFQTGSLVAFDSASKLQDNDWTLYFGLVFGTTTVANNVINTYNNTAYWSMSSSYGLRFEVVGAQGDVTASAKIPAFFYKEEDLSTYNLLYKITYQVSCSVVNVGDSIPSVTLRAGGSSADAIATVSTDTTATVVVKATGPYLYFDCSGSFNLDGGAMSILNVKLECLNYRAETQDFHLVDSYGMRNARYDGCKLVSSDWNVDSSDTVDGGPVVQIITGGGRGLQTSPSPLGTFEIV
jgi:hypothetical protein